MGHNHSDGPHPKLQIFIQPNIGMDRDERHPVMEISPILWRMRLC